MSTGSTRRSQSFICSKHISFDNTDALLFHGSHPALPLVPFCTFYTTFSTPLGNLYPDCFRTCPSLLVSEYLLPESPYHLIKDFHLQQSLFQPPYFALVLSITDASGHFVRLEMPATAYELAREFKRFLVHDFVRAWLVKLLHNVLVWTIYGLSLNQRMCGNILRRILTLGTTMFPWRNRMMRASGGAGIVMLHDRIA